MVWARVRPVRAHAFDSHVCVRIDLGGTRARGFFYEIKLQKNLRFLKKVPKMFIFCKSKGELNLFFVKILFFKIWTFSSFRYGPSRHQNGICLENIIQNTFCQKCSMCSDVRQQNNSPNLFYATINCIVMFSYRVPSEHKTKTSHITMQ